MAKTFYTDRDIVDLVAAGQRSLVVCDDVVLTDLAYEQARKLGLELRRSDGECTGGPAAPVRPYLNSQSPAAARTQQPKAAARPAMPAAASAAPAPRRADLRQKVQAAVKSRLGDQFDPALLDAIINRVLDNTGIG